MKHVFNCTSNPGYVVTLYIHGQSMTAQGGVGFSSLEKMLDIYNDNPEVILKIRLATNKALCSLQQTFQLDVDDYGEICACIFHFKSFSNAQCSKFCSSNEVLTRVPQSCCPNGQYVALWHCHILAAEDEGLPSMPRIFIRA